MKKRILSLLLAMLMIAGTCFAAPVAFAEETDGAPFGDTPAGEQPSGEEQTEETQKEEPDGIFYIGADKAELWAENCRELTADTTVWESGWYVVSGKLTMTGFVTVSGTVDLILCDGAELTVTGGASEPGIYVTPGNTLNIYGQKKNTGKLTASGGEYAAGIGGADSMGLPRFSGDCGNVAVYGGTVCAYGDFGAAGIGGAYDGEGGNVAVYGGFVYAYGDDVCGSGIGGGTDDSSIDFVPKKSGTASFYGGLTRACGKSAISSSTFDCDDGLIIYDVEAKREDLAHRVEEGYSTDAYIGDFSYTAGGKTQYMPYDFKIYNGETTLKGGCYYVTDDWTLSKELSAADNTTFVIADYCKVDARHGKDGLITLGLRSAGENKGVLIGDICYNTDGGITHIPGFKEYHGETELANGWYYVNESFDVELIRATGNIYFVLADGVTLHTAMVFSEDYIYLHLYTETLGKNKGVFEEAKTLCCVDGNGAIVRMPWEMKTYAGETTLTSGWYYIAQDTEVGHIDIKGNVTLVIDDGATLTVNDGIGVLSGNTLTLTSRSLGENMGTYRVGLTTKTYSDYDWAGIGGDRSEAGTVNVFGGNVITHTLGGDGSKNVYRASERIEVDGRGFVNVRAGNITLSENLGGTGSTVNIGGGTINVQKDLWAETLTVSEGTVTVREIVANNTTVNGGKLSAELFNNEPNRYYGTEWASAFGMYGGRLDLSCPSNTMAFSIANITVDGGIINSRGPVEAKSFNMISGTVRIDGTVKADKYTCSVDVIDKNENKFITVEEIPEAKSLYFFDAVCYDDNGACIELPKEKTRLFDAKTYYAGMSEQDDYVLDDDTWYIVLDDTNLGQRLVFGNGTVIVLGEGVTLEATFLFLPEAEEITVCKLVKGDGECALIGTPIPPYYDENGEKQIPPSNTVIDAFTGVYSEPWYYISKDTSVSQKIFIYDGVHIIFGPGVRRLEADYIFLPASEDVTVYFSEENVTDGGLFGIFVHPYLDKSGNKVAMPTNTSVYNGEKTLQKDEWYYVAESANVGGRLVFEEGANLVVADGVTLTFEAAILPTAGKDALHFISDGENKGKLEGLIVCPYLDGDGKATVVPTDTVDYKGQTVLADNTWYYVSESYDLGDRLIIGENVKLVIEDGCTLHADYLFLPASDTVTVYTLSNGENKGVLTGTPVHPYLDAEGTKVAMPADTVIYGSENTLLDNCWYYVVESIDNGEYLAIGEGSKLVLADGVTLTSGRFVLSTEGSAALFTVSNGESKGVLEGPVLHPYIDEEGTPHPVPLDTVIYSGETVLTPGAWYYVFDSHDVGDRLIIGEGTKLVLADGVTFEADYLFLPASDFVAVYVLLEGENKGVLTGTYVHSYIDGGVRYAVPADAVIYGGEIELAPDTWYYVVNSYDAGERIGVGEGTRIVLADGAVLKAEYIFRMSLEEVYSYRVSMGEQSGWLDGMIVDPYMDSDRNFHPVPFNAVIYDGRNALTDGWYFIPYSITVNEPVTVTGNVTLVLAEGSKTVVNGTLIVNKFNTLSVYAQSKNKTCGSLYAVGANGCAGIGGTVASPDCGNVAIYSGFVAAVSGNGAAGIGGAIKGNGGMVMIYGGIVTSIGENGAAGIGPGFDGKAGLTYVSPDLVITAGDIRSEFKTVETVGNELYVHIAWEDAEEDDDDPYSGILGDPNDVNGDESVTIADVTCLLDMLAGDVAGYSDLNRDGSMTIADVTYLLDVLSGNTEA